MSSGKMLQWPLICVQVHIPGGLLCSMNVVYFAIVITEDKIVAATITFQSSKMLSVRILNCCAVFWRLISLQIHKSVLKLDFQDCILCLSCA